MCIYYATPPGLNLYYKQKLFTTLSPGLCCNQIILCFTDGSQTLVRGGGVDAKRGTLTFWRSEKAGPDAKSHANFTPEN